MTITCSSQTILQKSPNVLGNGPIITKQIKNCSFLELSYTMITFQREEYKGFHSFLPCVDMYAFFCM